MIFSPFFCSGGVSSETNRLSKFVLFNAFIINNSILLCCSKREKGMKSTATISISSKDLDCDDVFKTLTLCGLKTFDVGKNKTYNNGVIENGCRIVTTVRSKEEIQRIWHTLKPKLKLGCCNLKIEGKFDGCINHYLKEYTCG